MEKKEFQDAAPVPESGPGQQSAAVAVQDESVAVQDAGMESVIVFCYPGTVGYMQRIYDKFYEGKVRYVVMDREENIGMILAGIVADETIADNFVIMLPNCVPCAGITDADLYQSVVYVNNSGSRTLLHGLPMPFRKDVLVSVFEEMPGVSPAEYDQEKFLEMYNRKAGVRPVEVGFSFGNYVTPVKRAVPCESVVLEALIRKKFLTCSLQGFNAIIDILRKHAE